MIWHLFTLLFVGLKLTHIIDWSWWLVLAPSIALAGIVFGMLLFTIIVALIVGRAQ